MSQEARALTRRDWLKTAAVAAAASSALPGYVSAATAEPLQLSDVQRTRLRGVLEEAVAKKAIPGGALAILSHGRVVFREAVGLAEFESDRPFTVESPCMIASVSKPISATYFIMLDEQGVISLDDPVAKFLPEFKDVAVQGKGRATAAMRVWHLLSHRSGLPGMADMGGSPEAMPASVGAAAESDPRNRHASLEKVVAAFAKDGLRAEPGARFAYGGFSFLVAARIAEVVLGKRFDQLLQAGLLDPLGMKHTMFYPDRATIQALPGRYLPTRDGPKRDTRERPFAEPGGLVNPAGGLCSRLDDLTAFLALHANRGLVGGRRLVKAESLARMYRPHPPRATEAADGGGNGYGLGWSSMAPGGVARHLGASGTMAWIDLKRQHAGMLLTQVKWGAAKPLIPRLMKEVQVVFAGGNAPAPSL